MLNIFRRNLWLILSLVVAVWAGRFLLTSQHFYTHDDMQVFRVNEYTLCLKEGVFPCRWSANLGKGYGYPLFNFYPPLIYLLPSLLHLSTLPITTSLNLLMFGSFILAGWGMYLLGQALTKEPKLGFLASVLYTLYPFHAINVFIRGVYGENLAWSLLPLLLYYVYQQAQAKRFSRSLPFLLASLYLTHLIGAFLSTGIVLLWAFWWRDFRRVFGELVLALGLSAFFFLPALAEKPLVQTESMISGYYAFTNHYVSTYQLFGQYRWSYDASLWNAAPDEMPFMVGHVHTILLTLLLIAVIYSFLRHPSSIPRHTKKIIFISLLLLTTVGLLFLSHFKSDFIWQLLPPLAYVQFPWRFIAWAGLPLVLAIVTLLSLLPRRLITFVSLAAVLAAIIYSAPFFRPRNYDSLTDIDIISGSERAEQQVKSLYDYLPHTVKSLPEDYPSYSETSRRTSVSYTDTFSLDKPKNISLPVFYYPGWTAEINGKSFPIPTPPDSGLITLALPAGVSRVILTFGETPVRQLANYLSITSLVLGVLYVILNSHGRKSQTL